MKKMGITKVELPESMKKVEKSRSSSEDETFLIVIRTFPSKGCKAKNDELGPRNIASKSCLKMTNDIKLQYKILLDSNGVNQDEIEGYEESFCDDSGNLCRTRRDDSRVSFSQDIFIYHFSGLLTEYFCFNLPYFESSLLVLPTLQTHFLMKVCFYPA